MWRADTHLRPRPVETQAKPLPYVISWKGPSICPVFGFLTKTEGFSFSFAWVVFEKCLRIGGLGSIEELLRKFNTYNALFSLMCGVAFGSPLFCLSRRDFRV